MRLFHASLMVLLVFIPAIMSCARNDDIVLEYKDVQFYQLREINGRSPYCLELSGLAFHSGLAVSKIETDVSGLILTIYVHLVPAKEGLSGSFKYRLEVPQTVNEVRFGNARHVIWVRPSLRTMDNEEKARSLR